tara:strand:+ start:15168 stop:16079 length:912 start_codon:yes stop_codon:yes gene_type:complete
MSEGQATEGSGSAEASAPLGGLGSQAGITESNPTDNKPIDWRTSIASDDIRNSPTISGLQAASAQEAIDKLAGMTVNAQKMIGVEKIPKLKEDASPEDRLNYMREHFGVPAEKDAYDFGIGDDAPDDAKEVAELFKDMAFSNGLNSDQAKSVYEKLGEFFESKSTGAQEAQTAQIEQGLAQLRENLGDRFESHLKQANAAADRLGGEELAQFLTDNPAVSNNPAIINAFQKAASMMMEDAPAGLNSSYAAGKGGEASIQQFENSAEWKTLLSKMLSNDATPAEQSEYNRMLEQRNLLYENAFR